MKKISNKNIYVKNPETGDYESIVGFQGESAYDAAVRLGKTNLSEEKWVAEYVEKRNEAIEAIDNEGEAVLQTLPDDYIKMSSDVRQKATAISNKQSGQLIHIPNVSSQQVLSLITHVEVVQSGSGDPSTNNIRPISGWDSVNATRAGKNLVIFPYYDASKTVNGITFTVNNDGTVTAQGTATANAVFNLCYSKLNAGTYYLSGGKSNNMRFVANKQKNGVDITGVFDGGDGAKLVLDAQTVVHLYIVIMAGTTVNDTFAAQLESGSTATAYDLYQGQTLTASLPETLYGFDINWTTGLVTVNEKIISYNGTENWAVGSLSKSVRLAKPQNAASAVCCSHYKVASMSSLYDSVNVVTQVNFHDSVYTVDVATWKAYLAAQAAAGTPVTIAYKLSTPTTIQLTPQQMETLKGTNTIWSNVGETEVVYVLDTKEYVDAVDVSKASVILENTSGNLITINDHIEDFPLKSLITTITPTQEGSGDPSPDNVRPISGWDRARVLRAGKNLFPGETYTFVKMQQVYFAAPLVPGDYTISAEVTTTDTDTEYCRAYFDYGDGTSVDCNISRSGRKYGKITATKPIVKIRLMASTYSSVSEGDTATWANVLLEHGSVATDYEPYQGQTLTANLPETVYGGYRNWTTGEQVRTKRMYQFTGNEVIQQSADKTWFTVNRKDNSVIGLISAEYDQTRKNVVCSHFVGASYKENVEGCVSVYYGTNGETIGFRTTAFSDVAAFSAFLREQYSAGTPVTIVFDMKPAYWTTLAPGTPQQLSTLKGTNNIWSDAGATEATYAVDTKMYADGKDSTAMIGTAEPGMVATKNYASGDFIVVGKSLYKATAAIANGETIVPGTNCTATTVVEQLEAIYKLLNT